MRGSKNPTVGPEPMRRAPVIAAFLVGLSLAPATTSAQSSAPSAAAALRQHLEPLGSADAVVLESPSGSIGEAAFWAWMAAGGVGPRDLARAGLDEAGLLALACDFADEVDLAQAGLSAITDDRALSLWRETLADQAYRTDPVLTDPSTTASMRAARLEEIASPDALLAAAGTRRLADQAGTINAFGRRLFAAAADAERRRLGEIVAGERDGAADRATASARPECLPAVEATPVLAAAAVGAEPYVIARRVSLAVRRVSPTRILKTPKITAGETP